MKIISLLRNPPIVPLAVCTGATLYSLRAGLITTCALGVLMNGHTWLSKKIIKYLTKKAIQQIEILTKTFKEALELMETQRHPSRPYPQHHRRHHARIVHQKKLENSIKKREL